jgi:peptidoglycan-associated lipoprotein
MPRQMLVLLAAAVLGLSACGGNRATVPTTGTGGSVLGDGGTGSSASTMGTGGAGGPEIFREVPGEGATGPLSRLIIYFDYDQSELRPEYAEVLAAHGGYLAANPGAQLRLEGHADERGSREYNIALGQRRSDGVKKMMILLGVREDQVESVSLGEEKPRAQGSTEDAWAQNRRSDILYPGEY